MAQRARFHPRILLTLVVLALTLLAACGDDDSSSSTTSGDATTPSTADSPTTSDTTGSTTSASSTTASSTTESSTTDSTDPTTSSGSTTSESPSSTAATTVEVYFSTGDGTDCSEVTAFVHTIDASADPVQAAFEELIGGPTAADQAAGASSFFSSATAGALRSVSVDGGVITVDFDDIRTEISNASTSCGSAAFTASLSGTAFQFSGVDAARYLFAGSCEDFGEFLQADSCEFERAG
ncbi:MAG: GerMN domain-containing protein [Acidimicrobiales bacterium]